MGKFTGYKIFGWVYFLASMVLDDKLTVTRIVFPPLLKFHFSLYAFNIFCSSLVFRSLIIYIWVWITSLSYMGDVQLFLSVGLWFVPKLGRGLSHYYFQYFSEPLFLSSLLRTQKTLVLDLQVIVQKVSGLYSYFLQNIFSTLFRFYNFYCFIFKCTDCFLYLHHCVVEPIYWDFILVINFFNSKIPICSSSGFIPGITWRLLVGLKWPLSWLYQCPYLHWNVVL